MNLERRSNPLVHAVLTGLLVATLGYSLYLRRELGNTQDLLREQQHHAALAKSEAVANARPAEVSVAAAGTLPSSAESEPTVAPPPAGTIAEQLPFREFSQYRDKRHLRLIYYSYLSALRRMNLTPAEMHRVADLLVEREVATQEARAAAATVGLGTSRIGDAVAAATKDTTARIEEMLGPERYAQLQGAGKINMLRNMITASVGIDMTLAGVPLTENQTVQMADIWARVQDSRSTTPFPQMVQRPVNPATGLTLMNDAIMKEAATVLSPLQCDLFRSYLAEQIAPGTMVAVKRD